MKLLDYNAVLSNLQYKPNFAYTAHKRDGQWWIRVVMLVENSRGRWQQWRVVPIPDEPDEPEVFVAPYYDSGYRVPIPRRIVYGYSPSREVVEVVGSYAIPAYGVGDELAFIEWMRHTFRTMEKHELDEWLKYKGELLNDPHKKAQT